MDTVLGVDANIMISQLCDYRASFAKIALREG